jgi:transposase
MFEPELCALENLLATATKPADLKRAEALMLRCDGWSCVDISDELGCHPDTVSRWWTELRRKLEGNVLQPRAPGRPPILNEGNAQLFRSLIFLTQSYARPYRGGDIKALLEIRGISMSLSAVYENLHKHDFSYQTARPMNPNRDEVQVAQWKVQLPEVFKEVAESNPGKILKLFFQDEARFGQKGTMSKQWAPVGERPTRVRQDEFKNAYLFGAVCPESGQRHFLVATDSDTAFMQIFLNNFSRTLGRGVHALLVLDNAPWHKTASLKIPSNVTLHFLPPYAPDLNPAENLWDFMKDNYFCNKVTNGIKELIKLGVDACKRVTAEIVKSVCARNYCTT